LNDEFAGQRSLGVASGGQARATAASLAVVAVVTLSGCGLVWLLPRKG
jgi:hypothetical protein